MIRVLVVDDHEVVREGICELLSREQDLEVIGQAADGEECLQLARSLHPDIVLLDVEMPRLGGIETTERLKRSRPEIGVIALTMHDDAPFPQQLLAAGADGCLGKACAQEELVTAVRQVQMGRKYLSREIAQSLALSASEESPFDTLSGREMEVMMRLIEGEEVNAIAEHLSLSPKTIATYKYRLLDKLAVKNEVELTRLAVRYGITSA